MCMSISSHASYCSLLKIDYIYGLDFYVNTEKLPMKNCSEIDVFAEH